METALLAAGIAALVSLLGLLANISIARATRRSVADQARFAASIAETRDSIARLRKYASEIESLRSSASLVMMSLGRKPSLPGTFEEYATAFEVRFRDFFHGWDEAKPDIPDERVEYVRMCRHSCKNAANEFWACLATFRAAIGTPEQIDNHQELSKAFSKLGYEQEQLRAAIASIRNDKLEQLILSGGTSVPTPRERYFYESRKWT